MNDQAIEVLLFAEQLLIRDIIHSLIIVRFDLVLIFCTCFAAMVDGELTWYWCTVRRTRV